MGEEADYRRADEDTGVTKRGDRWNGDVLRHNLLATHRSVKNRHDIGATGTHQRKSQHARLPRWNKRGKRQTRRSNEAANDDDKGATDPSHDRVTCEPADGHGPGERGIAQPRVAWNHATRRGQEHSTPVEHGGFGQE